MSFTFVIWLFTFRRELEICTRVSQLENTVVSIFQKDLSGAQTCCSTLRAPKCTLRLARRTKQDNMINLCTRLWPAVCSGCHLLLTISQVGVVCQLEVSLMAPLVCLSVWSFGA